MSQEASNQPSNSPPTVGESHSEETDDKDFTLMTTLEWSHRDPQTDSASNCPICLFICFTRFDFPFHHPDEQHPRTADCQTHFAVKIKQCGHIFGLSCLHHWLFNPRALRETCPLCRVQVIEHPEPPRSEASSQALQNIEDGIDITMPDFFDFDDWSDAPRHPEPLARAHPNFEDETYSYDLAHYTSIGGNYIYRRRRLSEPSLRQGLASQALSRARGLRMSPNEFGSNYVVLRSVPRHSHNF